VLISKGLTELDSSQISDYANTEKETQVLTAVTWTEIVRIPQTRTLIQFLSVPIQSQKDEINYYFCSSMVIKPK